MKESTGPENRFSRFSRFFRSFLHRLIRDLWLDIRQVPSVFYMATAFLAGVKCGYSGIPSVWMIVLLCMSCILSATLFFLNKARHAWVWLSIFVLFFSFGTLRSAYDVHRKISDVAFITSAGKPLEISCRIGDLISTKRLKGRSARYRIKVEDALILSEKRSLFLPLTLNWYGDSDPSVSRIPSCGEKWLLKGRVYCQRNRDYSSTFIINSGENSSRLLEPVNATGWEQRLLRFRNDSARRISIGIEDWKHVLEINQAVLLGFKENIPRNMKKVFACSGTIHVFAISGLHIALIASVFVFIVSTCGVPRYYWIFLLTPLLLAYTFATGMRPSAVRATLMALLFFAAPFLGRRFNAMSALAAAAIIVHVFSPAYISDIGCILSFSVMLGLVVLYKPVSRAFELLFRVDSLIMTARLLSTAGEERSARRYEQAAGILSFFAGLCAVTLSAWLASMPLSGYYFGRITPGGLIANLVISPCALMLVIAGVIGFAVSFVSSALAAVFNNAAGFFTYIMIKTASFVSGCPGSNFKISSFPAWLVWGCFGLLFLSSWLLRRWIDRHDDGLDWMGDKV